MHCEVNQPEIRQINGGGGGGSNGKLKGVLIHNLQSKAWPKLLLRCMDTLDITPHIPEISLVSPWWSCDATIIQPCRSGRERVVNFGLSLIIKREGEGEASFFCPSVLNPDHAWKHNNYRVDIKFSNLISFREEVKYTLFMAVNCPKKVYYVFVSASPSCQNYFKPFGLTLQSPVLQCSSTPVQCSSPALQSSSPDPVHRLQTPNSTVMWKLVCNV